ncbi:MAG: ester cyclase [Clostridiales bacterium]|nr:ester cyclase [Clostridiales bacterium]
MTLSEMKNKQMKFELEGFEKGDLSVWDELLDENVVFHPTGAPDIVGVEAYKNFMSSFLSGLSDRRYQVNEIVGEGDTTVERYSFNFRATISTRY